MAGNLTMSEEERQELKKLEGLDEKQLQDIARGIKAILQGKIKEV